MDYERLVIKSKGGSLLLHTEEGKPLANQTTEGHIYYVDTRSTRHRVIDALEASGVSPSQIQAVLATLRMKDIPPVRQMTFRTSFLVDSRSVKAMLDAD